GDDHPRLQQVLRPAARHLTREDLRGGRRKPDRTAAGPNRRDLMNSQANPFQRQRADMRRRGKSKSLVIRIPETTHAGLLHRAHCPAVLAASVALLSWCTLVGAGNVFASAGDVDPCTAVPS